MKKEPPALTHEAIAHLFKNFEGQEQVLQDIALSYSFATNPMNLYQESLSEIVNVGAHLVEEKLSLPDNFQLPHPFQMVILNKMFDACTAAREAGLITPLWQEKSFVTTLERVTAKADVPTLLDEAEKEGGATARIKRERSINKTGQGPEI